MTSKVLSGGDKLEAALAKLSKNIEKASTVQVGWAEGATYPNGTSVAYIAALQEYGTGSIPPRPFFRTTISQHSKEWGAALGAMLKATDYDAAAALGGIGEVIRSDLKEEIRNTDDPALSPVTMMLRALFPVSRTLEKTGKDVGHAAELVAMGVTPDEVAIDGAPSSKPLIWTGQLMGSISVNVDGTVLPPEKADEKWANQ